MLKTLDEMRSDELVVCMGNDERNEWAPWLEPIVAVFKNLASDAENAEIFLENPDDGENLDSIFDFCRATGIRVTQCHVGEWTWVGSIKKESKGGFEAEALVLVNALKRQLRERLG